MGDPILYEGTCGVVEWAACGRQYANEARSGDAFLVEGLANGGTLVGVVDGLGHGAGAADVAEQAVASLRRASGSLADRLQACHEALHGSRGVLVTLAAFDPDRRTLSWLAIGNVEAILTRGEGGRAGCRWWVTQRGGVLGFRLPSVKESTLMLEPGDVVVLATDGVSPHFVDGVDVRLPTRFLAQLLYQNYARSDDDALVLAARWAVSPRELRPPPL